MKKYLLFLLLLAATGLFSQAQNADSAWLRANYFKIERMVPMRDGIRLFTAVYIPKDSSRPHPILFTRTPYSCWPYGEDQFGSRLYDTYWINYLRKGYIIALQDVRGKWMSEGDYMDIRPFNPAKKGTDTDEASDTYDAIEWMLHHVPGNNGRVGVFGISYPGFYATMAALSGHPALKAVSPQAPVTDWFMGDDFHHNGAFCFMDGFDFYSGFGKPRPHPTQVYTGGYDIPSSDNYDFYLRTGALKNFNKLMGDSIAFWKDLYNHPNYDDWWKARNPRNFVTAVKPAILVVGGLFDAEDCYGAWNLYKAIEAKSKQTDNRLVMGPWFHGAWGGRGDGAYLGNVRFGGQKTSDYYQQHIEIPFFEYHLNNTGTVADIAEASIFFSGENRWRQFDQWPPKNADNRWLVIGTDGRLTLRDPAIEQKEKKADLFRTQPETVQAKKTAAVFSEYISDPAHPVPYTEDVHLDRTREYMTDDQRFAGRRPDVLSFSTAVLQEDLTLAGPVMADLVTSISTTDADFVVKIIDVFPDDFKYNDATDGKGNGKDYPMGGYQMLVRGEIMRGRYRNSFEKPEPFVPNKITQVKYALPDIAHTFKKGHRLMIQIQSSWFPLMDRNPQQFINIYHCDDADFRKAAIRIYHDPAYQTKFIIPVLK